MRWYYFFCSTVLVVLGSFWIVGSVSADILKWYGASPSEGPTGGKCVCSTDSADNAIVQNEITKANCLANKVGDFNVSARATAEECKKKDDRFQGSCRAWNGRDLGSEAAFEYAKDRKGGYTDGYIGCECFVDKSMKCKWQADFCCCQRVGDSLQCVRSTNYAGEKAVCNAASYRSPDVANKPEYKKVGDNETNCGIFIDNDKSGNNVYDTQYVGYFQRFSNCSWVGGGCWCDVTYQGNKPPGVKQEISDTRSQTGFIVQPLKDDGCNYATSESQLKIDSSILQKEAAELNQLQYLTKGKSPQGAVRALIGQGVKLLLSFIGSIALVLYIYAGILWMSAAGNTEQITKAKQVLIWTSLGVVVMLASYIIVQAIFGGIIGLSGVSSSL